MAIKISGSTIIDDSRVLVNADKIGIGQTTPRYDLEIFSTGTPTGIAVSATSTQDTDTNKAISIFNNSGTINFGVSYRGRVDAEEYFGTFKGTIDTGVAIDKANTIDITDDTSGSGTHYIHFGSATDGYDGVEVDSTGLIYKDGKLGIGTDNPQAKLHVNGDIYVSDKIATRQFPSNSFLDFDDDNDPGVLGVTGSNYVTLASISGINLIYDTNDNDSNGLVIAHGNPDSGTATAVLVTDSNGNVGIGTDNPQHKLHIDGDIKNNEHAGIGSLTVAGVSTFNGAAVISAGAFSANLNAGGRNIAANIDIRSVSARTGIVVRNVFDYRTDSSPFGGFQVWDPYDSAATSYAFIAAAGATLVDNAWIKTDGTAYFAGSVGIATAAPSERLHVYHATENLVAKFESGDAGAGIIFKDNTHSTTLQSNNGSFEINVDNGGDLGSGESLSFKISDTEKLKIDSDGNLLRGGTGQDIGASNAKWDNIYANKVYADIEGSITPSGSLTITDDLTVNGNTTLGDASGDSLTVNATSTFNAGVGIADSIFHLGDDNTQIRFPAADTITAETGGDERLRIASDGTIQLSNLFSAYTSGAATRFSLYNTTNNHYGFHVGNLYDLNYNAGGSVSGGKGEHVFHTAAVERLRITEDGYVGIGTTNPSQELTVYGANPIISVQEASVSSQVDIGTGTVQGFINIQKADGTRTVQISSDGDTYFNGGNVIVNNTTAVAGSYTYKLLASDNISSTEQTFGIQYPGVVTYGLNAESNADFTIKKDGTERLRIHSGGLVEANSSFSDTYTSTTSITPHFRARNQQGADNIYGGIQLRADRNNGAAAIFNIACLNSSTNYASELIFQSRNTDGNFSEKLRIASDGDVGIGTDSPSTKLDVNGTVRATDINVGENIAHIDDTDTKIVFTDNKIDLHTGGSSRIYADNSGIYVKSGFPLAFLASSGASPHIKSGGTDNQDLLFTTGTGNPTRLTIKADGKVGIGTDNPGQQLDAASNLVIGNTGEADSGMTFVSTTGGQSLIHFSDATSGNARYDGFIGYEQNDRFLKFGTAQALKLTIDSDGNLLRAGTGQNIGASDAKWDNIYAETVHANIQGTITPSGSLTITDDLTVNGNTTLGDASSDSLTVNASSRFIGVTTFINDEGIFIKSSSNSPTNGAQIKFSDYANGNYAQIGHIKYKHGNGEVSPGTEEGFIIGGSETLSVVKVEGRALIDEKVGIGTSTPATELDVAGDITIRNGGEHNAIRTTPDGKLQFLRNAASNNTVTVTIDDANGNVGIGLTDPDTLLHLQGDKPKLRIESTNALEASAGTEEIGRIEFEAKKSNNINVAASLRVRQDGTWSTVDDWFSPTAIEFYTQDQSGTEITKPRLTINNAGKVGIGTDNPGSLLTLDHATNPAIQFKDSGTKVAQINAEGTATNIASFESKDLVFAASTSSAFTERLRITSSGITSITGTDDQDNFIVDVVGTQFAVHTDTTDGEISLRAKDGSGNNNTKYMTFFTEGGSGPKERVRIKADGGTALTRTHVGGRQHTGNTSNYFKIGTWKGFSTAGRAKITVFGTSTFDSGTNNAGESIIYLAFAADNTMHGHFHSISHSRNGIQKVAYKVTNNNQAEVWIKYNGGYAMTKCMADVSIGTWEGNDENTGSTSTPTGATDANIDSMYAIFTSDGSQSNERLRITSDGKVGINSTSPSNTLVVQEPTDNNSSIRLFRASTGGDIASIIWATNQGNQAQINYRGGGGSTGMQFYTGGTGSSNLRAIINTSGNVGIGTHDPQAKLDVTDGTTSILFTRTNNNPHIDFKANNVTQACQIKAAESAGGGVLQFFTKNTSGTSIERLNINTSGHLLPGGTSQDIGSSSDRWNDIFAVNANFSGTVTYDDVTNINSVGVITARDHIKFANSGDGIIFGTEGSSDRPSIIGTYVSATDNHIVFNTAGNERVRIKSDGNVSIGSTADGLRRLDVVGNSLLVRPTIDNVSSFGNASTVNNSIIIRMPYGENPASTNHSGARFGIQFTGANNTTDVTSLNFGDDPVKSASIYGVSEDNLGYNRKVGLVFYTSNFDAAQTERLRITSDGKVGIGTVSTVANAKLDVWGDGSEYPTLRLGTEAYNTQGEDIRFGRIDHPQSDIRYHSIYSLHHATAANNYLKFSLHKGSVGGNNELQTDVMYLQGDGKVGINEISNINGRLHVQHDALAENILYATRYNDQTNDKPILAITEALMSGMNASGLVIGNHNRDIHIGPVFGSSAAVTTTATLGIRIKSDGRIGINTATVYDTNTMLQVNGKTNAGPNLVLHRNDTSVSAGQVLGALRITGNDSNGTQQESSAIEFVADLNHGTDDKPGRIVFKTTDDGASSATEKLRITSSGQVQINRDGGNAALFLGASQDFKLYHDTDGPTIFSDNNNQGLKLQIKELIVTEYTGVTERLRITSDGFVGINEELVVNGLTINKSGDYSHSDGNTYYQPVGKWLSAWGQVNLDDGEDHWVGFTGKYGNSSASVNISLAPNFNNTSQQAGMYIAGEAIDSGNSDFTVGKIVSGSSTGQGTSGNVRATKSELFRITSGGNVGIGTNNPTGASALTGNNTTLAVGNLKAGNITGPVTGEASKVTIADGADNRVITAASANTLQGEANLTFDGSTLSSAGNINCTSGRLQRGTATVQDGDAIAGGLNINGTDMDASLIMSVFGNDGDFTRISGSKSRNASVGSHTIVQDNDVLLSLKGFGSDGNNFEEAAQIEMQVDGTPGNDVMPGRIVFKTATTDGVAERLRITSSGNVGIGTDDPIDILDINSDSASAVTNMYLRNHANLGGAALNLYTQGTYASPQYRAIIGCSDAGGNIRMGAYSNHDLLLLTNNDAKITIKSDGKVGIGITDPTQKLSVSGDINFQNNMLISNHGGSSNIDHIWHSDASNYGTGGTWNFVSDSTAKATGNSAIQIGFLKSSGGGHFLGDVGIGTTNPTGADALTGNNTTLAVGTLKATSISGTISGTITNATNAAKVSLADDTSDADGYITFSNGATGNQSIKTNDNLRYDAADGILEIRKTDGGIKFGPGTAANDDAHIEWKGTSNAGYLRISTSDDSDSTGVNEYIEFGDYAQTNRTGAFTQHVRIARNQFLVRTGSNTITPADRFLIDENGNVGIGTVNPGYKLELHDASGSTNLKIGSRMTDSDYGIAFGYFDNLSGNHGFGIDIKHGGTTTSNGFVFRADTGNVGINSTIPTQKLDVNGTVKATAFEGPLTGTLTGAASQLAMTDQSSDSTCFPVFVQASGSGNLTPHSNTSLTFNASTGQLGATSFSGGLPITDGANNRIITATSASAIKGESDLTFDGSTLAVTGGGNPVAVFDRGSANNTNLNLKYNGNHYGQVSVADKEFQLSAVGSSTTFKVFVNGTDRFMIDVNGNIGVNATPKTSGTLYSTVDHFLVIGDNDTGIAQDGDGQLEIWANDQEIANFNTSNITLKKATTINGNLTVDGTVTYEDVTNVSTTGIITAAAFIATGGTVDSGTENDPTNVAMMIENNDYIYTNDSVNSKRKLIGKSKSAANANPPNFEVIEIGQTGTALIDRISMLPGNGGDFRVQVGGAAGTPGSHTAVRVSAGGTLSVRDTDPKDVHFEVKSDKGMLIRTDTNTGADSGLSGSLKGAKLLFSDSSSVSQIGHIVYKHSDNSITPGTTEGFIIGGDQGTSSNPTVVKVEGRVVVDEKVGIGTNNPLHPLHIFSEMGSSPSFIHMQVTGSNTVGGGGGIAFDTSASNSDSNNSLYLATIAGIRNSANNGSNDLVFSTTKANVVGDDGNTHTPKEKLRITMNGGIAFSGASNYGSSGQILKSNGDAPPTWIDSSTVGATVDVKQYKVGSTERSCTNPITVNSGTIGITSASNAFGARYISTEATGGTYCDGDIWYDTTGADEDQDNTGTTTSDIFEATKFFQNPTSLTQTTTFPASGSKNGGVFGPYEIANGVTFTISSGSTFTIL